MFAKRPLSVLCLSYLLLAAMGCSQGPIYEINEQVRGTLTLDGKPLANVRIQFVPKATESQPKLQCPLSTGFTDDHGSAGVDHLEQLVRAGRDQVSDRDGDPTDPLSAAAKKNGWIPPQYTVASTSPYVTEVTKDQHDYKVDLSSK